jgi:hypothetical protein
MKKNKYEDKHKEVYAQTDKLKVLVIEDTLKWRKSETSNKKTEKIRKMDWNKYKHKLNEADR